MPTFTAMALDRLIEPRDSKSIDMQVPSSKPPHQSKPLHNPNPVLKRRHSTSVVGDKKMERKVTRPQITPALYTTPETTPLPDSPSSFPPSPYIINHKRRGPRLVKSFSQADVVCFQNEIDEGKLSEDATKNLETKVVDLAEDASVTFAVRDPIGENHESDLPKNSAEKETLNGFHDGAKEKEHVNGELRSIHGESVSSNGAIGSTGTSNGLARNNDALGPLTFILERDGECEDFFDPQDSMSLTSNTDVEDIAGPESSAKTPGAEFYDAWEELSSESGQHTSSDVEAELREIRLSLLMEIEKRKQAEESLKDMRDHWQMIRQGVAHVGLILPEDPTIVLEGEQPNIDPAEELCQQVYLARFVSESIGKGIVKAEMEVEMENQIESKNFEIARLCDRLRYYEAMNREMSQRNQEAVEMARRDRQKRKRRQRWVWGSIAAAITLGTAAIAWSYLPAGNKSASSSGHRALEHNDAAKQ